MKDYAEHQGNSTIRGSRDATREAFQLKLVSDGHIGMGMIISRNKHHILIMTKQQMKSISKS
jgi:hypothetical protein